MPDMTRVTGLLCESLNRPLGLDIPHPRISWRLDGDATSLRQIGYRVRVSASSDPAKADLWDSGRVASDQSVQVEYAGLPLRSRQRCAWDVTVWTDTGEAITSAPSWWETGLIVPADFTAQWINHGRDHQSWTAKVLPAPLLRRAFTLPAAAVSARAYVCGLGYYELYVNGERAGDAVLQPNVSQYDRRARYVTHDVTALLRAGENAVGVVLGNGWFNAHTADVWHFDKASWRNYPMLWLQLEITLADGTVTHLRSDPSWKIGEGPITFDGLRNGETYDARREIGGWASPGFDDTAWQPAVVASGPGGLLTSQWGPACHVAETIEPVEHWSPSPGVTIHDIGQNVTGWARVRVSGAAGRTLTLQYGEQLTPDRDLDAARIDIFVKSGDFQTDRFTPATDAPTEWEPRFTYHGFRYVRATWTETPTPDDSPEAGSLQRPRPPAPELDLEARVVETDLPEAGNFTSSDPMLDRIHQATRWSFRGNFTGIPTDCPHREKNGWTGDAQLAVETGLLNFRVGPAYRDWVESVADAQRPSGQLPGIVPTGGWGFNWGSGPAWDAAFFVVPWNVYLYTGDDAMIRRHYAAMRRYVDYCRSMTTDHVAGFGLGDWCPVDKARIAPTPLTSTSYYYAMVKLLGRFARLVGDDGAADDALAADIRLAFNAAFYKGDGVYGDGGMTSMACAVYQGLVDPAETPSVIERLADAVRANGAKPDFGILGAKWVPRALADHGHVDLAYRLLTQPAYPGWAHWISEGATTLHETWDGNASRNHIMFGDIDAWMFHYVAGIRPDPARPGFRHAVVRPHVPTGLDHFDAWHATPYGRLRSAWRREGAAVRYEITVPPNSTATITLPDGAGRDVGAGTHGYVTK